MNIAIVGCGYVAESYAKTLGNYPELKLSAAYDRDAGNLQAFCRRWQVAPRAGIDELLDDPAVELVLNLTNPRSHYEVSKRCLEAGKHVYSEKPLAMDCAGASELVDLAQRNKVRLASAPCSLLGETAQTAWKALRENAVGRVRLVLANFHDGMIAPKSSPWLWRNELGVPWPAKDEFEVGCTYEHSGYVLTWLAAFFGPARQVTSFASCLIRDKGIAVDSMAPDFAAGCIEYRDGVLAQVTCSIVAPNEKSLTIVGDDGLLFVPNVRNDVCPVYVRSIPTSRLRAAAERRVNGLRAFFGLEKDWHLWTRYPLARRRPARFAGAGKPVDFCRGPAEVVDAIRQQRPCRLSPELGRHVTELIERLQYPGRFTNGSALTSTFDPIQPLPCLP